MLALCWPNTLIGSSISISFLSISKPFLESSFDKLLELTKEIISHSQFTNLGEMTKLTQIQISNFEGVINNQAHILSANRALSQVSAIAKLGELASGIDYFNYLKGLLKEHFTLLGVISYGIPGKGLEQNFVDPLPNWLTVQAALFVNF